MPPTRYVRTPDGVDLAYRVFEGGPASLVMVPVFAHAMEVYWDLASARRLYEGLASFARVVDFDPRGSGMSGRAGVQATLEMRVRDLGVIMDAAGMERAALFGGYDGAAVAAMFAATNPKRVSALTLIHPTVRTAWAEDFPWGSRAEEPSDSVELSEIWNTLEPTSEQIAYLSGDVGSLGEDPSFRRFWGRFLRNLMTPAEFEAYSRIWLQTDVRDILPSIQAPTLLMHRRGPDDGGSAEWEMVERSIPGAVRRELPGTEGNWFIGDVDAIVDAVAEHLQVARPAPPSDRVLASVLFTDIVDSTRRAAELGDAAWKDLLGAHDEIERTQLERFGGRFVHTTGDGMLATFDGPARAVHCAQAIAAAVRPLGVEIRAGVHTGEVELIRGEVQGLAVHIGARVAAKAGPSEVWTSSTVKDLTAGSGLTFEDAGEHELKGVPDRWRLYRVVA